MPKYKYLTSVWDTIKEVDLSPLRQQALHGIQIAIVGSPGSGRATLADQMRRDPGRPHMATDTPLLILDLNSAERANDADLIILMMDIRKADSSREQELVKGWYNSGKRVLVFINQFEELGETSPGIPETSISPWVSRGRRRVVWGSPLDRHFLVNKLAPVLIDMLPNHLLSLGRFFPLFRHPIARYLINDTCVSNAAYALSTGLAEIVPVLNFPLAVADTVILTKNQAFLVYKLGLALGYSTRWQDYFVEFGSVLGSGFMWRQIAHTLVAMVPVWGIVPKTTIAYAGTYVIGNVILQWYLTGRRVSRKQIRQIYRQALGRGREIARNLLGRIPRPRGLRLPRLRLSRRKPRSLPAPATKLACKNCGKANEADANFCQYCGESIEQERSQALN
jgi:uncharacterized protein (DUF697 family)